MILVSITAETSVVERILIKKIGILFIALLITAGLGAALYHYMTTPRQEGVAHLKPAKIKLYSGLTYSSSSFAAREKTRPVELIDLPPEVRDSDAGVFYFSLPIGKNNIFAIIQKPASGNPKAWIDADMDNRLSDEKALSGTAKKHRESRHDVWEYFDFGKTRLSGKNFTSAPFYFVCGKGCNYIDIRPVDCMRGKIRLGGRIYRVAVVDGDYDGKFSTLYEPSENRGYWGCDVFAEEPDTYSLFRRRDYDAGKIVPLGKYFKFDRGRYLTRMPMLPKNNEGYFSIALSADGKTLRMQPTEPAMGTLKIGETRRLSIQLLSDTATQWVNFSDEVKLPAGQYQMHSGELSYTHKDESDFKFWTDFRKDIRKGRFAIIAGQTVTLNPGPPFTVKSDVSKRGKDELSINAGLIGNEGEEYGLRISRSTPKPTLKILDENDKEVHAGTMEYG